MTSVVQSHYKLFSKLCPFFLSPLLEFCAEHSVTSMTEAIGFGNFTTTFDFASAQHFDNDFSWACGFWYNVLSEKNQLIWGTACLLRWEVIFLFHLFDVPSAWMRSLLSSAGTLHGTFMALLFHLFSKRFRLEFACIFFLLNHILFQTRIGTSMQLTQKHVHAEFAALNKFNYHAAECPVRMDLLHAWLGY